MLITTRHLGPTDTKGSRVKAFSPHGSVTVSWDHSEGSIENHMGAAVALARRLNGEPSAEWRGAVIQVRLIGAALDNRGYAFEGVIPGFVRDSVDI